MLWKMIEHEKTLGKFTTEGAIASMLFDRLKGRELSQREYSKVWGWSRGKLRHKWDEIDAICTALELKSQQPNVSPIIPLNTPKNSVSQPNVSPQLYNTIINTNTLNKPIPSASIKHNTRQKGLPSCIESYDQVKQSWNEFAGPLGLALVRSLSTKRKQKICTHGAEIWPVIDEVYEAIKTLPFYLGKIKGKDWKIDFDYLWANSENYNKLLEKADAKRQGRTNTSTYSSGGSTPVARNSQSKWSGLVARDTDPRDSRGKGLGGGHEQGRDLPSSHTGTHG